MLTASGTGAILDLAAVSFYEGTVALAHAGIASTLLPENLSLAGLLRGDVDAATRAILFDPQTSGGLLAGIPKERAAACVRALRSAGYGASAVVGSVGGAVASPEAIGIQIRAD